MESGQRSTINMGWFRVNWDAAVGKQTGRTGLGVVIRDHHGELMAARSLTYVGLLDPAAAEAVAATMAIQLAWDKGYRQVYMEGDVKVIIDAILEDARDWSRVGHLVEDIRSSLQHFTSWKMAHVRRVGN